MTQPRPNREFNCQAIEAIRDPHRRLCVIMQRLLDPGGCPWDREQTHRTLRQYLIEEAYEAAEAIDAGDDAALAEELGDVALQIVFHAELAERRGAFAIEDVYESICRKLIGRHPHVFGTARADTADAVLKNWEQLKKEEKRRKAGNGNAETEGNTTADESAQRAGPHGSALSGVPRALPSLQRAGRLQERASHVGFDWERPADVAAKVREEVEEFLAHLGKKETDAAALAEELGDLLFSLVNLSRFLDIRAEEALAAACDKFSRRFAAVERAAEASGRHLKEMTLAEMDALWDEVKRQEREKPSPPRCPQAG
jgi:tetrapyrrole methylase family protein/MazG family protein